MKTIIHDGIKSLKKMTDEAQRKNPSVLDACEIDARSPGGKAEFIIFARSSNSDWVLERTADCQVVESGTLKQMLDLIGTKYPNARRATWAEDTLRLRPGVFFQTFKTSEGDEG